LFKITSTFATINDGEMRATNKEYREKKGTSTERTSKGPSGGCVYGKPRAKNCGGLWKVERHGPGIPLLGRGVNLLKPWYNMGRTRQTRKFPGVFKHRQGSSQSIQERRKKGSKKSRQRSYVFRKPRASTLQRPRAKGGKWAGKG